MEELFQILQRTKLFAGLVPTQLEPLLLCMGARQAHYAKGACVIEEGDTLTEIGVVLSGTARAVKCSPEGSVILISLLAQGSEVGALLAAHSGRKSPVTVQADSALTVLFFPFEKILSRCHRACAGHDLLLRNAMALVAEKGLLLHERLHCLLQPSIRAKVLTYLSQTAGVGRSGCIPLSRNAMAQYLNVDRSALSRELSRMQRDGLLQYHKNHFVLSGGKNASTVV